jgi:hypothetical protein
MTWIDDVKQWVVLTVNPAGHRLPQMVTTYKDAWRLAQPPTAKGWDVMNTKEELLELFRQGMVYGLVAVHADGSRRYIVLPRV